MSGERAGTLEDYRRAESFLPWNIQKRAFRLSVQPNWINGSDRFWYRVQTRDGAEFVLVNPDVGTRQPAFDHARLASALSLASGKPLDHHTLPFQQITFVGDGQAIQFDIESTRWTCDLSTYACVKEDKPSESAEAEAELRSPDEHWAAFVRDYNLWLRDLHSGAERQLTSDGERYHEYGTPPESRTTAVTDRLIDKQLAPCAAWSPDSKRIVSHRIDQRPVRDMHLLQSVTNDGNYGPVLHSYKMALPGDEHIGRAEVWIFDAETGAAIQADTEPLNVTTFSPFAFNLIAWSESGDRVCLINPARDYHSVRYQIVDAQTGTTSTAVEEHGATIVMPALSPVVDTPMARISNDGAEALWFSERDGWGHLYRIDSRTGDVRQQVTSGPWAVRELLRVEEDNQAIYFTAGGREPDREPYYRHLYRVSFDGSGLELLTAEDADHQIGFSPSGRYVVDNYSRIDTVPVAVLRRATGEALLTLEEADFSALFEAGWHFPERFRVKARDGVTDIYGIIIRPTTFEPGRTYPVLDSIYPGPQIGGVPKTLIDGPAQFSFWPDQALAELGFIIVNIDGFVTPFRSKAFHDMAYGTFEDGGGLPDHITGLRQLAARYPELDLERVGIFGHSGGGYASARALMQYPDFYKVAVSSAGNHDQRGYLAGWGELYLGLLDGDNYVAQANPQLAGNLRGKLLLAWGDMDDNVHPAMTIQLIDALIKANKDVDLLILPNANHGFIDLGLGRDDPMRATPTNLYFMRRTWDYFVRHLLGVEPPAEYRIQGQQGREPATT